MSKANWIREADLGGYLENHNFNLNPLVLDFEADTGAVVKEINGAVPDGLNWTQQGFTVAIEGVSTGVSEATESNFTLRITDPDGTISDRTFYISILPYRLAPSWAGQDSFLGYATIGKATSYTVSATFAGTTPIVYRIIGAPQGMSINPATGVISYLPPTSLIPIGQTTPYEQTFSFSIRATVGSIYETLPASVTVLGTNHAPAWITVAGRIGEFISGRYVETYLQAYEPNGDNLLYTLVSPPLGFPFTLEPSGFLYGPSPTINDEIVITFTVLASSVNGATQRTFNVLITQDTVSGLLRWKTSSTDLGYITDGGTVSIDVGAVTSRPQTVVNHRFVGGSLPPNVTLNNSQGMLAGYVEYHPQPRQYFFDIEASDGYQTISRKYTVTVLRGVKDQYMDVSLPVMSDIKQALATTKMLMIDDPTMVPDVDTLRDDVAVEANLISGLGFSYDDPYVPLRSSNLYLNSTTLNFGQTLYTTTNADGDTMFLREVLDPLVDSSYVISQSGLPYTIHPPSLQNMRKALGDSVGFANNGRGSGANLIALIDYETTAIRGIQVVTPGSGFYFSPEITITGTGTGAIAKAILTVVSVDILEKGTGWALGDTATFMVDRYNTVILTVSSVTSQGGLISLSVTDGGSFELFPTGSKTITNGQGSYAQVVFNLGISSITMLAGGVGYSDAGTEITTSGYETLESWESSSTWFPWLRIGTVKLANVQDVIDNNVDSVVAILANKSWRLQHLVLTMQGKTWVGNTLFDEDEFTLDGGQTRFTEWLEPIDTVFELDDTYFDRRGTRFDDNPLFQSTAMRMWGTTIFDAETTIFDLYDTMFDMAGPGKSSITVLKKLYRLRTQQISGNNTVA